jgi:hypothetical protein
MRNMQTTTYSLHIPKPCHQGWDKMQPSEGGRFCSHCSKTVVDFTLMSDAAIQQYFIQRQGQGVCGHFKTTQLQRIRITLPGYMLEKRLKGWQKFLVLFLICFGGNFMGIDVLWGGNGNALYAQTVTKSKGVTKAKKSKAKKKRARRFLNNSDIVPFDRDILTMVSGIISTKPEPNNTFPKLSTCQSESDSSIDEGNMNNGPSLATQTNSQNNKETPPQNIPQQRKEYLLPLVGRKRKKRPKRVES